LLKIYQRLQEFKKEFSGPLGNSKNFLRPLENKGFQGSQKKIVGEKMKKLLIIMLFTLFIASCTVTQIDDTPAEKADEKQTEVTEDTQGAKDEPGDSVDLPEDTTKTDDSPKSTETIDDTQPEEEDLEVEELDEDLDLLEDDEIDMDLSSIEDW